MKRYLRVVRSIPSRGHALPCVLRREWLADQEESVSGDAQETTGGMSGMDHVSIGIGGDRPKELIVAGEYSDERFIDPMADHHQDMAEVVQREAELPEMKRLADYIVSAQRSEIQELSSIKEEEFVSSEVPAQMDPEEPSMSAMEMPDELEDASRSIWCS